MLVRVGRCWPAEVFWKEPGGWRVVVVEEEEGREGGGTVIGGGGCECDGGVVWSSWAATRRREGT